MTHYTVSWSSIIADKANIGPTHIPTPAPPVHVALSSDGFTLSVCVKESGMVKIYFYDTRALANKVGCDYIYWLYFRSWWGHWDLWELIVIVFWFERLILGGGLVGCDRYST